MGYLHFCGEEEKVPICSNFEGASRILVFRKNTGRSQPPVARDPNALLPRSLVLDGALNLKDIQLFLLIKHLLYGVLAGASLQKAS